MSGRHDNRPNRPITEQIDELRSKIQLCEGDQKAYYESAQWTIKKNKDKISNLRKENKELRKKLRDRLSADDHVINKAFKDKPVDRAAMSNKTGRDAITTMDYKVSDTKKRLNALRHTTAVKQKRLEELRTQYEQMNQDASDAVATDAGESEDAQKLRNLENRLDKATMKCNEAEHIRHTYERIKACLQQEQGSYETVLVNMENEIIRCRAELKELKQMNNDAINSKEAAQRDLQKHEEMVYRERKEREIELQRLKKEADEKKLQHERTERRIAQRGSISQEDMNQDKRDAGEGHAEKIITYEEHFKRIQETTGVSSIQEVVARFENQDETNERLEVLKKDNERKIIRLKEEKEKLQDEFEQLKYSGEAKLSSGQRVLEEFQTHLQEQEDRRDDVNDDLDKSSKLLIDVKSGVEHLSNKLAHLKAQKSQVPQNKIPPTSDEYVLDLLSTCEEKLLKLLEELDGVDINQTVRTMEEEEFHASIEGKLPAYNTRVKLPSTQKDNVYDEEGIYDFHLHEDESADDDGDILTRNTLKNQSQNLIDSKLKRKKQRKKKK